MSIRQTAFPIAPRTAFASRRSRTLPRHMRGLSLIELMIAMLLGLLVVGGAIGIFLSNQQAYRATESLSRIQENARVAFELMARDIREAGGTPCAKNLPTANVLNNPVNNWFTNWGDGIRGYEGASADDPANRVVSADMVDILSAASLPALTVVDNDPDHDTNSANFKLNQPQGGLINGGDIILVCDYRQASILQVSTASATSATIRYNTGGSQSPGNCSKGLGVPTLCTTNGNRYEYGDNSLLVKLSSVRWFVGTTPGGTRSLYRSAVTASSGNAAPVAEEVIPGVQDLQLEYLMPGATAYEPANSSAINWPEVLAVRVRVVLEGEEQRIGTDGNPLSRTLEHIVSLRTRNP